VDSRGSRVAAGEAFLVDEMTYGKLVSESRTPPEDLNITSRSAGLDDETVNALQLPALLEGQELTPTRIDPLAAKRGVFGVRVLPALPGRRRRVALFRARLRDHISLGGVRRAHPQMVVSVIFLDAWREFPLEALRYAKDRPANPVSMDLDKAKRFGFPPARLDADGALVWRAPPPLSADATPPGVLAVLAALAQAPRRASEAHNVRHDFGAAQFPDEDAFLEAVGEALRHIRPESSIWERLTIASGADANFPGLALRYLPSSSESAAPAIDAGAIIRRLQASEAVRRLTPQPIGARTGAILERAASRFAAPSPPSRAAAPAPVRATESRALAFARALKAYRAAPDAATASALIAFVADERLTANEALRAAGADARDALACLRRYNRRPGADLALGLLFDGVVFLERLSFDPEGAELADAWREALAVKIHHAGVLDGLEVEFLAGWPDFDRVFDTAAGDGVREVWSASREVDGVGRAERLRRRRASATKRRGLSVNRGVNQRVWVDLDALIDPRDFDRFGVDPPPGREAGGERARPPTLL
jgi:hypothetical protein